MARVIGDYSPLSKVKCKRCGNIDDFDLSWLGDLHQNFSQADDGERDYDSHENEGEYINIDYHISCHNCGDTIASREISITVGDWELQGE